MSTKCTISHGPSYHFYEDCFDEDNVYLELNQPKESNFTIDNYGTIVMVSFNKEIMDELCSAWLKKSKV